MDGTGRESRASASSGNLLAQALLMSGGSCLQRAQTFEQATAGIEAGFNAVMPDNEVTGRLTTP